VVTKRKKLIKQLDELTKEIIKKRDNYACQKCGKKVEGINCHWSHIIPVSRSLRLRWDFQNSMVKCFHCHINWWHKHPLAAANWFKKNFPKRWKYLSEKENEIRKILPVKLFELEELIVKYRKKLRKLRKL